ncbi:response regulator [Acidisoma cladoniae]|jgi:two-component system KDP operon response regulator KdpE|uniref:response regulator n=1 Tax=Acidisoma cladoniae TaxID=3040935 RepID=UPI00254F26DA|nr:response regulator transcription factor [Acidisoma sp. PAMC 29798]
MTPALGKILVIDDEKQIHRFLAPALIAAGYAVEQAMTAAEGLRLAAARAPDLVLLDLGLPDEDGQQALQRLRQFSEVPVIILSARDREGEKITALDNGADDYVEKPFGVGELLARIRAALRHRRMQEGVETVLQAGPLTLDIGKHEARDGGVLLALSRREYALLEMLMRNLGKVITHRQLLTAIWGPAHAEDMQYLRVYIWHLRQKLSEPALALLINEPGVGYRLLEAPMG